jgi:hypothetical protein
MSKAKIFTVFWRDGRHLTVKGSSPDAALMREGYKPREQLNIAFFVEGEGREYDYDKKIKQWVHDGKPIVKPDLWQQMKVQTKKPQPPKGAAAKK